MMKQNHSNDGIQFNKIQFNKIDFHQFQFRIQINESIEWLNDSIEWLASSESTKQNQLCNEQSKHYKANS